MGTNLKHINDSIHLNKMRSIIFECRHNQFIINLTIFIMIIAIGALIFYFRYPYAYNFSNFYAEDGKVFLENLIVKGPIAGIFTLFNGYLVVGQYLVGVLGQVINVIFGHGFVTLAKAVAVASYIFWGFVCALPWLLFRKKIGVVLSLIIIALLWITPLGGYDYAVIGTIGNLKFAFFFIAALLVVYRNQVDLVYKKWQFILIDMTLLLCVFTNIISVALLPFTLWRYRSSIYEVLCRKKSINKIFSFGFASILTVAVICIAYLLFVRVHGLTAIPGYLDGPLIKSSLINIVYTGSLYGLLFPINFLMNNLIVVLLIIFCLIVAFLNKQRPLLIFFAYAILVDVFGFVLNRPGITASFKTYENNGGPGFFFYAGMMIFAFGLVYSLKDWYRARSRLIKALSFLIIILYVITALPFAGSRGASYKAIIEPRPTLVQEVNRVCYSGNSKTVEINVYPSPGWSMILDRKYVCAN